MFFTKYFFTMNLLTFFTLFIALAMFLIILAYGLAEFKAKRFKNSCIYLEELVKRSDVNEENYTVINQEFNNLDAISDQDVKRKRSLWSGFQFKFKEVSPYTIKK